MIPTASPTRNPPPGRPSPPPSQPKPGKSDRPANDPTRPPNHQPPPGRTARTLLMTQPGSPPPGSPHPDAPAYPEKPAKVDPRGAVLRLAIGGGLFFSCSVAVGLLGAYIGSRS